MNNQPDTTFKAPAKVLACLRSGYLTVSIGHGLGIAEGGILYEVPMQDIPFELRLPNSVFTATIDRVNGQIIRVESHVGGD